MSLGCSGTQTLPSFAAPAEQNPVSTSIRSKARIRSAPDAVRMARPLTRPGDHNRGTRAGRIRREARPHHPSDGRSFRESHSCRICAPRRRSSTPRSQNGCSCRRADRRRTWDNCRSICGRGPWSKSGLSAIRPARSRQALAQALSRRTSQDAIDRVDERDRTRQGTTVAVRTIRSDTSRDADSSSRLSGHPARSPQAIKALIADVISVTRKLTLKHSASHSGNE